MKQKNSFQGNMAMTELSSYENGSSSSSAGSSKNHNCYHAKCPQRKGFSAISSSCSSSYNFLAKFKKVVQEKNIYSKIMRRVSINTPGTATSATNRLETLDISRFPAVAVPENSATSSATTATKNQYEGRKTT